jgi:hypothetical protein
VGVGLLCKRHCAGQQVDGGRVSARQRVPTGGPQPGARCPRNRGVSPAELDEVERRLLEVVAEDLVQLYEARSVLFEPVREAAVELGSCRLGQSVIGSIAHEEMPEAIRILS